MAWTDTCKIHACKQIERVIAEKKKLGQEKPSVREACKALAPESGIPAETLRGWYKNRDTDQGQKKPLVRVCKSKKCEKKLGENSPKKKSGDRETRDFQAMRKQVEKMLAAVESTEKSTVREGDRRWIRLLGDGARLLQGKCEELLAEDEEDDRNAA